MSKKTLLSEAQVRQFMKYANMGGLTDNFVNEMYGGGMQEKEEDLEEVRSAKANEEDMDEGMDADAMRAIKKDDKKKKNEVGHKMEEGAHPGMDEDDHPMEEVAHDAMKEKDMMEGEHADDMAADLDADVDKDVEDMVAGLVSAIAAAIEDETGVDIAVDADGGEEVEAELDLDADMGDMDVDLDADLELPGDEGPEEEEVEVDMVAEVTKRVMARIQEAKAAKKLQESRAAKIDQVADRILERIMNKK